MAGVAVLFALIVFCALCGRRLAAHDEQLIADDNGEAMRMGTWYSEKVEQFRGFLDTPMLITLAAIVLLALSLSGLIFVDWMTSQDIPWTKS